MTGTFTDRLNAILPRITSDEFLTGSGIGNEIAFYIFDYPPEQELDVRDHIRFLLEQIPKKKPSLRLKHIDLFDLVIDHLKDRKLLDRCFDMQKNKGDEHLLAKLQKILTGEKIANVFGEAVNPDEADLVVVSGVGSVWPLLRSHSLLNNLHSRMGQTPLVMFYPGKYDGQSLRLFGKVKGDNYYRAFRLGQ
jgi:hypothetical protein